MIAHSIVRTTMRLGLFSRKRTRMRILDNIPLYSKHPELWQTSIATLISHLSKARTSENYWKRFQEEINNPYTRGKKGNWTKSFLRAIRELGRPGRRFEHLLEMFNLFRIIIRKHFQSSSFFVSKHGCRWKIYISNLESGLNSKGNL